MKRMATNPSKSNILSYLNADDILSGMLNYKTNSYKTVDFHSYIEIFKDSKEEFGEVLYKLGHKKLKEFNKIEYENPGCTFMFFENESSLKNFIKKDFSIALKRFDVIYTNKNIKLLNHEYSIIMDLFLIDNLKEILNELKNRNLSIVFDNTYNHYKHNKEILELVNFHFKDKKNITFVFKKEKCKKHYF